MEKTNNRMEGITWEIDIKDDIKNDVISIISMLEDTEYVSKNSCGKYEVVDGLEYFIPPKVFKFDKDRTLHFVNEKTLVVVYKDKNKRDKDAYLHKQDNVKFFDLQSPIVVGTTDIGNNYYLILQTIHTPDGATNGKTYDGVIINPTHGLESTQNIFSEQILKDILGLD